MPDPLMDTLDEIDRKSGTFLLSPRVSLCLIRYRGTLLVTEGTSPISPISGQFHLKCPLANPAY